MPYNNQPGSSGTRARFSDIVPKNKESRIKKIISPEPKNFEPRLKEPERGVKSKSPARAASKIAETPASSGFFAEFNPKRSHGEPALASRTTLLKAFPLKKYVYAVGIAIFILVGGALILNSASFVTVLVTPQQLDADVDSTLQASASGTRDLALDVISLEDEGTGSSETVLVSKAETKASGKVIIYNAFDTYPQQLIASTRLEAPNGNIYRIPSALTVPGAKLESGKIVPQGVETDVIADRAGAEYNLGLSDFTIPGFKGTAKYNKFYARSKTELTGGLIGSGKIVTQVQINELVAKAKQTFTQSFEDKTLKDLPEGTYLPDGASDIETSLESVNPQVGAQADRVTVKIKGKFTGLAVKKSELFGLLAKTYAKPDPGDIISISNWNSLNVDVVSKNITDKTLMLRIKGKAHFVWEFQEDSLISDLIASRADRKAAFGKYKAITKAEIIFNPPWWRIFPTDKRKIKIEKAIK